MADEMLRVCIVTTFFPPYHYGGDATCAERLATGLARRGHEVTVVHSIDAYRATGGRAATARRDEPGVETVPLERRWPRAATLATYLTGRPALYGDDLRSILERRRFDVIHYQNVSLVGGPGVLRLGTAPVKLYTMHEHWLVCPMHVLFRDNREPCTVPHCVRCSLRFRRPPQPWRHTRLLETAVAEVDLFLPPSRFTQDAHRARGFDRPMRILAPFVPAAEVAGDEPVAERSERPYVLFVGRLERLKGVQVLLEAFRRIHDADLLVVGSGTHGPALRAQAADLGHVRFLGSVAGPVLGSLYRGATALVVPSVGYETFGIVGLEAMARGTPVIVNDLGALPELVEGSDGGGLVYSGVSGLVEALRRLLSDRAVRDEMGRRAAEAWRLRWSDDPHFDGYLAAVEDVRRSAS